MKWALVGNPTNPQVAGEIRELAEYLKKKKQVVQYESLIAEAVKAKGVPLEKLDADIFITVGGDGTILLTLEHTDRPVLAVNAGGLGFLSEVEPKYASNAIDRILKGDYRIEERTKLSCFLDKERLPDAANEVTVQTSRIAKLIEFRVEINGEVSDTLRGDGLIISTPTGSTGYSLSVGGPILHPSVDAIVISPIAPFRLGARPIVVPYSSTVQVTLIGREKGDGKEAKVVVDGQHGYGLTVGDTVLVKPSDKRARFIRFQSRFFDRVRTKLIR